MSTWGGVPAATTGDWFVALTKPDLTGAREGPARPSCRGQCGARGLWADFGRLAVAGSKTARRRPTFTCRSRGCRRCIPGSSR